MLITTKFILPSGTYVMLQLPDTLKMADNFTVKELANNKATEEVKFLITPESLEFIQMVQEMRILNGSMTVNSCYRTESFNARCGGDPKSAHLRACALDWAKPNQTEAARKRIANQWQNICDAHGVIGSINYYTGGYHLEAFSDKWYKQKVFKIRDYRGKKGDW